MEPTEKDLEICQRITRQGGSNLSKVSKALSRPLKNFFTPAYASMRLIDDIVDEGFLELSPEQRVAERDTFLARVQKWEEASIAAVSGDSAQIELNDDYGLIEGEIDAIFRAMSSTVGQSNLGPLPWQTMSAAMQWDVLEKEITDWADFEAYGWGATVSPTAVYLYLLTCRYDKKTSTYSGISGDELMEIAKPMGLFCYLVHILRDLEKDAKKDVQLLTLPTKLVTQIKDTWDGQINTAVVTEILNQATHYREQSDSSITLVKSKMSLANKLVFKSLFGLYDTMYDRIMKDQSVILGGDLEENVRAEKGVS